MTFTTPHDGPTTAFSGVLRSSAIRRSFRQIWRFRSLPTNDGTFPIKKASDSQGTRIPAGTHPRIVDTGEALAAVVVDRCDEIEVTAEHRRLQNVSRRDRGNCNAFVLVLEAKKMNALSKHWSPSIAYSSQSCCDERWKKPRASGLRSLIHDFVALDVAALQDFRSEQRLRGE